MPDPMSSARLAAIKAYCEEWQLRLNSLAVNGTGRNLTFERAALRDLPALAAAYEEVMKALGEIERDCERLHGCVSYTDMRTRDGLRMIQMRALDIVREFEGEG